MDTAKMHQFIDERARVDQLDFDLKEAKAKLETLAGQISEDFATDGIQAVTMRGVTMYLGPDIQVSVLKANRAKAIAALRAAGLGDYVSENFSTTSLKAWVRERLAAGEAIPAELAEAIKIFERMKLHARNAAPTKTMGSREAEGFPAPDEEGETDDQSEPAAT